MSIMENLFEGYLNNAPVFATDSFTMDVLEQDVRLGVIAGAETCTLPPVAKAKGRFYSITAPATPTQNWTVASQDGTIAISETVNAANETLLLYSTGYAWLKVYSNLT